MRCEICYFNTSESESQLNLETWNIFQTGTRSECDSAQIWLLCCRRLKNGSEYKITTTLLGNTYFLGVYEYHLASTRQRQPAILRDVIWLLTTEQPASELGTTPSPLLVYSAELTQLV